MTMSQKWSHWPEEGLPWDLHAPEGVTLTQLKSNIALGSDTEPLVALSQGEPRALMQKI
jgi:hypothetical protein